MARLDDRGFSAAQLAEMNPIVGFGTILIEADTLKAKYGNGTNHWNDLPYWNIGGEANITDGDKGNVTVSDGGESWQVIARNDTAYNFQSGGEPKYHVDADTALVRFDPNTGDLAMGQNLLDDPAAGTNAHRLADFRYLQKALRLLVRNITLGELGDPCDINGRRFGPEGGYPYADIGSGDGTYANLTGLSAGANVFQIRATPARVLYGGDENTIGGAASDTGALINFSTAEMPRQLTPDNAMAVGMHIDFNVCPIGANETPTVARVTAGGNFQVGVRAVGAGDQDSLLQVRAHQGTNAVQTITMSGTVIGGTFTLSHYPTIPLDGYPTGEVTAAIDWDATAGEVQTALEGLASINPGDVTCTGGPLPGAAVVVTFTGTLAGRRWTRMTETSDLDGDDASVNVVNTTNAADYEGGKRLLDCRHTPSATGDYFRFIDSAGNNALTLTAAKTLQVNGILRADDTLQHNGASAGFMGKTPITRPAVTGSRGGNAALASLLSALDNLGLITNSTSA